MHDLAIVVRQLIASLVNYTVFTSDGRCHELYIAARSGLSSIHSCYAVQNHKLNVFVIRCALTQYAIGYLLVTGRCCVGSLRSLRDLDVSNSLTCFRDLACVLCA